ncbi:TonB family protein [Mangrovimicrobium sediminis]|uniref:Protein TonB n=1 Tax=Mangrovimicrobium sediminis TaxID=2562682 RepID=A0A4Z0LV22_9GAMM|nr:TonB family protein [Haliea sp. SAOS-164]TGD70956.1 TonB family protein [Haliea sp. SAOS-164]
MMLIHPLRTTLATATALLALASVSVGAAVEPARPMDVQPIDDTEVQTRCQGYALGTGSYPEDADQAYRWCRESAERGIPRGQAFLGSLYYDGTGVMADTGQAIYWFTLAANQDDADAIRNLGVIYLMGKGVPQNTRTAFRYLSRAAELGDQNALSTMELFKPPQPEAPSENEIQAMLEQHGVAKFQPVYPEHALQAGIEGFVELEYCVDRDGRTTHFNIIRSVPAGVFDAAAIDAAKQFRYRVELQDGVPVERHGVGHRFSFELE